MASTTITSDAGICQGARSAFQDASSVLEMIWLDIERLTETAYALACSEAFNENAQHSFYTLAKVAENIRAEAKGHSDRYAVSVRDGSADQ